jgi:hypothetical protein
MLVLYTQLLFLFLNWRILIQNLEFLRGVGREKEVEENGARKCIKRKDRFYIKKPNLICF